jgi:hypothetical protein
MTRQGELSDILDTCAEVGDNLDLLDRLELVIGGIAECDFTFFRRWNYFHLLLELVIGGIAECDPPSLGRLAVLHPGGFTGQSGRARVYRLFAIPARGHHDTARSGPVVKGEQ